MRRDDHRRSQQATVATVNPLECTRNHSATSNIHTNKFLTRPTCQFASESGALRWRQKQLRVARLKQFSFKPVLNVKNVSAERVWTPSEFQTVGAAAQNALAANDSGWLLL